MTTNKYEFDSVRWLRNVAEVQSHRVGAGPAMLRENMLKCAEEIDALRARVAGLEEALGKIRDYDCYKHPDDDIIAIREAAIKESENCTACQHAKKAKWPPSGLCNEHYRTVTRAQERVSQMFSHKQTWGPREIARRALEEK